MNVTADVKDRLLFTPYCAANPPDLSPIQKQSSSGSNGQRALRLVMLYASGWRRLNRNKRHPRQKRTSLNGSRRKASGLRLTTTIQPPTPRWWSDFSCAIKGIPLQQCPAALLIQPSQDVRFRPVVLAVGQVASFERPLAVMQAECGQQLWSASVSFEPPSAVMQAGRG